MFRTLEASLPSNFQCCSKILRVLSLVILHGSYFIFSLAAFSIFAVYIHVGIVQGGVHYIQAYFHLLPSTALR